MQPHGPYGYGPNPYANPYGGAPRPVAPPPVRRGPLFYVAVVAGALVVGSLVVALYVLRQQEVAEFGPVTNACAGRPVPGARAMQPGQGHRFAAASSYGGEPSVSMHRVPSPMRSHALAETDVVLCFGETVTTTLEQCTYQITYRGRTNPTTYPRTVQQVPVRLVVASTGQEVSSTTLTGSVPPPCDSQGQNNSANRFHVEGSAVGENELLQWLQSPATMLP